MLFQCCFSGSPLQGLYDQYCQQVDVITQQVVQQHTHVISTTILHDAESQHFSDTKEFYEVAVILYIKLGLTSLYCQ